MRGEQLPGRATVLTRCETYVSARIHLGFTRAQIIGTLNRAAIGRLILDFEGTRNLGTRVLELVEELQAIMATEVVFDFSGVALPEDLLPPLAAALRALSRTRDVKVSGLRGTTIRSLVASGVGQAAILVGRWPRPARS